MRADETNQEQNRTDRSAATLLNKFRRCSRRAASKDILHGNVLLHGWVNAPDSFITIFLPLYVLGGLLTPHMAILMYAVPAITYVVIVASAQQ